MENISLSYRVMSGDDRPEPDRRALRLGVPEPWYEDAPLEDELRYSFENAVGAIRGLGHEVHPIQMPDVKPSYHIIAAISEVAAVHREFRSQGKPYGNAVAERIAAEEAVTPEEEAEAREWQKMLRERFADALATVDFLITPTTPARRKVIGHDEIDGKSHRTVLSYFTSIVNHALHPALSMPILDSGAPPASLQVIGGLHSEVELIGLGRWLEDVGFAGFTPAPGSSRTAAAG
jgi:Asp-tRNA(Asn)/Glu-tRNA(Gln) amidotransferase A subunit family amidase